MVFLPGSAEAQRRGVRVHAGGFHRTAVVRTGRVGYRPGFAGRRVGYYGRGYRGGGYYGRRYGYYGGRSYGYRPAYYGAGVAAGLLTTGAIAAAAGSPYYGYGYGNPNYYGYGAGDACLRQQRVWTGYAYQSQWVRVC
jgi:hypothetical protein